MAASVLVVDDNANMRQLLEMHLRAAGYDVQVAEDGIAAGYAVLRSPPDLIITDVQMPHMDGFEFVAALRADRALPRFPVIFLTTMEEGELRGRDLGAVGYHAKPIRLDKLLELVAANVPDGRVVLK
ncbi:MAG TPA: response regulator [Burkholderiales bacterium]